MSAVADHECPWPSCTREVPFERFACGPHWFRLPRNLRRRLNRAWRGQGTERHEDVLVEAIDKMNQLAGEEATP